MSRQEYWQRKRLRVPRRIPLKATGAGSYFERRRGRVYTRRVAPKTGYWAGVQALNEVRRLKRDEEIKEKTAGTSLTVPLADTGITQYLNDIDQGTTISTRIGNKIVIKSVQFRAMTSWNALETGVSAVRIAIVYDRKPNGNKADWNQIFDTNKIRGNINSANPLYAGRFQVLFDETYEIDYNNIVANSTKRMFPKTFIRRSMKCEYNATGGGIADCQKGALLLCACGSTLSHDLSLAHNTKIKYADS